MGKLPLTLVVKNYDHVAPLACGDVDVEGVDLRLDRDTAHGMDRMPRDPSIHAGEMSLSRHLGRLAEGDNSFVAIPIFPLRAFRHRCFFVRRGSDLRELEDLKGKRIGTNEWPATGNTWSRAALRERGVEINEIDWWVGTLDGGALERTQGVLPPHARLAPPGRGLRDMLLTGELDALMWPSPPKGFYNPDSPIVRLLPDHRRAEREYYCRTGIFPTIHVIALRRAVFDESPWVARSLFQALDRSRLFWQETRLQLADTTPWLLADMEEAAALFGPDWRPNGVEPNRKVVQTLCDEVFAQGLAPRKLDGATVFAEFEAVANG